MENTQETTAEVQEIPEVGAHVEPAKEPKMPEEFKITRASLDEVAKNIEELVPNKYVKIAIFQLINDNLQPL